MSKILSKFLACKPLILSSKSKISKIFHVYSSVAVKANENLKN